MGCVLSSYDINNDNSMSTLILKKVHQKVSLTRGELYYYNNYITVDMIIKFKKNVCHWDRWS